MNGSRKSTVSGLYAVIRDRYGDPAEFVRRLKSTMILHGISQNMLALRSGYHRSHVSRWMSGKVTPNLETMLNMDEAIECLISGE